MISVLNKFLDVQ